MTGAFHHATTSILILFSVVVGASGCDAGSVVLSSSVFGIVREARVSQCCQCLDRAKFPRETPDIACPSTPADATTATCLCGIDRETCTVRLLAEDDIVVVGRCVDPAGPCAADCDGVLAFPDE